MRWNCFNISSNILIIRSYVSYQKHGLVQPGLATEWHSITEIVEPCWGSIALKVKRGPISFQNSYEKISRMNSHNDNFKLITLTLDAIWHQELQDIWTMINIYRPVGKPWFTNWIPLFSPLNMVRTTSTRLLPTASIS